MPNRILRSWTDSLKFDGIPAEAERLFVRLIMVADDYGRYHAEPRLVRSACFPLESEMLLTEISSALYTLEQRKLIFRYTTCGKELLAIVNYGQRLKQSRPKFPPPPDCATDFVPEDDSFVATVRTAAEPPPEAAAPSHDTRKLPLLLPTDGEILTQQQAVTQAHNAGVPEDFAVYVFADWESRGGRDGSGQLVPWPRYIKKRWNRECPDWESGSHKGNRPNGKKPQHRLGQEARTIPPDGGEIRGRVISVAC